MVASLSAAPDERAERPDAPVRKAREELAPVDVHGRERAASVHPPRHGCKAAAQQVRHRRALPVVVADLERHARVYAGRPLWSRHPGRRAHSRPCTRRSAGASRPPLPSPPTGRPQPPRRAARPRPAAASAGTPCRRKRGRCGGRPRRARRAAAVLRVGGEKAGGRGGRGAGTPLALGGRPVAGKARAAATAAARAVMPDPDPPPRRRQVWPRLCGPALRGGSSAFPSPASAGA